MSLSSVIKGTRNSYHSWCSGAYVMTTEWYECSKEWLAGKEATKVV